MFDKQSLDTLFDELRDQYELEPDWEEIQRDAHLGVARLDGGWKLAPSTPAFPNWFSATTPASTPRHHLESPQRATNGLRKEGRFVVGLDMEPTQGDRFL